MDSKDILGFQKNSFPSSQEKKPPRESPMASLGRSTPSPAETRPLSCPPPTSLTSSAARRIWTSKKRSRGSGFFTSSARADNLQLFHWARVVKGVPPSGDYSFAKYNKKVDILKYTDEEYEKHLTDPVGNRCGQRRKQINCLICVHDLIFAL